MKQNVLKYRQKKHVLVWDVIGILKIPNLNAIQKSVYIMIKQIVPGLLMERENSLFVIGMKQEHFVRKQMIQQHFLIFLDVVWIPILFIILTTVQEISNVKPVLIQQNYILNYLR